MRLAPRHVLDAHSGPTLRLAPGGTLLAEDLALAHVGVHSEDKLKWRMSGRRQSGAQMACERRPTGARAGREPGASGTRHIHKVDRPSNAKPLVAPPIKNQGPNVPRYATMSSGLNIAHTGLGNSNFCNDTLPENAAR